MINDTANKVSHWWAGTPAEQRIRKMRGQWFVVDPENTTEIAPVGSFDRKCDAEDYADEMAVAVIKRMKQQERAAA